MTNGLTSHQHRVVSAFLTERSSERRHLAISLTGAHAYGFPSPDSDIDLKCIHIAPLRSVLALEPPSTVADRIEFVEGVELDYGSNEVGPVLSGILRGNGNFLERVLGAIPLHACAPLNSLRPVVRKNLSLQFYRHYHGFASNQRQVAEEKRAAKKVLYVLRTALTGAHLLQTGEVITDVTVLAPQFGIDLTELLEAKRKAEKQGLSEGAYSRAVILMNRVFELLDAAKAASTLPEKAENSSELEEWLFDLRRSDLV